MYHNPGVSSAYSAAGVDTSQADRGVEALVEILRATDPGRSSLAVPLPGHYASVIRVSDQLGIALATDSVGSKVIVAEQTGRFSTIGIDCVAMNVNDLICVGATPLAMLDYVAVERAEQSQLRELALGLRAGAELAGIEIPGGEVCQLPEVIRGHPSPNGFDLVGSAFGTVALEQIVDGGLVSPGNVVIGLPSSGVHSNGLTLARRALLEDASLRLDDAPSELVGASVADALLEPTAIYVRAIRELLESPVVVHGLAHITGGGLLNLLRIGKRVGFEISDPLPVPAVFDLIARHGAVEPHEMWEVFNMGCGFCVIVPRDDADAALEVLGSHHQGSAVIGTVNNDAGHVRVIPLRLVGDRAGLRPPAD
jgi:phosphoribosylformylglycinamidine cyclo-ligase